MEVSIVNQNAGTVALILKRYLAEQVSQLVRIVTTEESVRYEFVFAPGMFIECFANKVVLYGPNDKEEVLLCCCRYNEQFHTHILETSTLVFVEDAYKKYVEQRYIDEVLDAETVVRFLYVSLRSCDLLALLRFRSIDRRQPHIKHSERMPGTVLIDVG